jgi:pyruvate dehydrogenase E1 component beta subunit
MFADFFYVCADEVLLKASQWRLLQGGTQKLPLVFFANMGGYRMLGNEHSQCPYSLMLHSPGLKVVVPSTPYDAKGLMKMAIRDNNPVFFLYHKGLLGLEGEVPEDDYTIPFGQADVKREGDDITVIATALMLHWVMEVAEKFKDQVNLEVIDPRTLEPLDLTTILKSVEKTGRVLIVDEDTERCGFAGDLSALIMEHGFDDLDAPVKRICAANYPIPACTMERHVLPQPEQIAAAIQELAT